MPPGNASKKKKSIQLPRAMAKAAKSASATSGQERGNEVRNAQANFIEELSKVLRKRGDATAIIRALAADDTFMSTAVYSMTQIANSGYKVIAYDSVTGAPSQEGTIAARNVLSQMDTLSDYSRGFNKKRSIPAVTESMLREVALTGGLAAELVLDKFLMPSYVQLVPYEGVKKVSDGKGDYYPAQKDPSGGADINLNIPNFFIAESNLEAAKTHAISIFRSGLSQNFMFMEFLEDMRRGVRKTGHSRIVAKLISEKIAESAPEDIKEDPKKLAEHMQSSLDLVKTSLEEIEPEDAVVSFDSVEMDVADVGGSKSDYAPLLKILANMTGSSMKTPSSISGLRSEGSQSLSNAETLTYLKVAKSLCNPVQDIMSRILTLAVRLQGLAVQVRFVFNPIDLRPELELEAYKSSQQNRVLQLLSVGLICDTQAAFELNLPIRPEVQLSGTGFMNNNSVSEPDPDRKDAMGKDLNPGTPTKAGGSDQ